jgi:hypothetical protein
LQPTHPFKKTTRSKPWKMCKVQVPGLPWSQKVKNMLKEVNKLEQFHLDKNLLKLLEKGINYLYSLVSFYLQAHVGL